MTKKEYHKEYHKEYYKKNKEKIKLKSKKWREYNSEYLKSPDYKKRMSEYYKKNLQKGKKQRKEYYKKNREIILDKVKIWVEKNKEKVAKYQKDYKIKNGKKNNAEYYKKNKEIIKKRVKIWAKNNKSRIRIRKRGYTRNRSKNDIHFKLKRTVSSLVNTRLKSRLSSKNGKSTWDFLPYTVDELIQHLEKQFVKGMTWDNHGKWHIDHIRPDCSFNYKSVDDEEFQKCWALKNLQPLWAIDNFRKNGRYTEVNYNQLL